MDDNLKTALILGGVALGGYFLYKAFKKPTSAAETYEILQNTGAGITDYTDLFGTPKASLTLQSPTRNTTYFFGDGDFDKLNIAQKAFISLDKIIPGDFLTRWALE